MQRNVGPFDLRSLISLKADPSSGSKPRSCRIASDNPLEKLYPSLFNLDADVRGRRQVRCINFCWSKMADTVANVVVKEDLGTNPI